MQTFVLVLLCVAAGFFSGCDRHKSVPNIPEKKSSFEKTVFTDPRSSLGETITLISETECEMGSGQDIKLATYSRQDNKLRVVVPGLGGSSVIYFEIQKDGLRNVSSGQVYLLREALIKFYQDPKSK